MAPTAIEKARSATAGRLFGAALLCALGGWLPALGGDWRLLALAAVCVCGGVWAVLRDAVRDAVRDADRTVGEGPRRPLRRIAEAERETLARHRLAP